MAALHFDAFVCSVFELIDLHTDTLDGRQYIGYLKKLVDEIMSAAMKQQAMTDFKTADWARFFEPDSPAARGWDPCSPW